MGLQLIHIFITFINELIVLCNLAVYPVTISLSTKSMCTKYFCVITRINYNTLKQKDRATQLHT